jgi:hypothetical protein
MQSAMLTCSVLFSISANSNLAVAEIADCNSIKNGSAPIQYSYRAGSSVTTVQSFRDKSGNYVLWTNANGTIQKTVLIDGLITSAETASPSNVRTLRKFTVEGMPKNWDRKSNIRYKFTVTVTKPDGTTDTSVTTASYVFKSEGKEAVGSCVLTVIRGEIDSTPDGSNQTTHLFNMYFPELMAAAIAVKAYPVVEAVTTDFSPLALPR